MNKRNSAVVQIDTSLYCGLDPAFVGDGFAGWVPVSLVGLDDPFGNFFPPTNIEFIWQRFVI